MILGKIAKDESRIRITEEVRCGKCSRKVPGGITTSKRIHGTEEFYKMLKRFKASYLCGTCRDAERVSKSASKAADVTPANRH